MNQKKIETCKRCRKLFPVDLCFSVGRKKWRKIDENGKKLKKIAKSKGRLIRESEEYSHFSFEIKLNTFLHLCSEFYKKIFDFYHFCLSRREMARNLHFLNVGGLFLTHFYTFLALAPLGVAQFQNGRRQKIGNFV